MALKLTIGIIAYNEETFLPNLLADLVNQTYPHELMEVVLVDGKSEDGTKNVMLAFQEENHGFYSVQVLDNPKRIQAAGWNVVINNATGDVISRIDAHTSLPDDFAELVVQTISTGEDIVGGIRPCIIENETPWGKVLLQTENSLFGSSINKSRHSNRKQYVKTMFHASYRREVFEKVGLFNEILLRTEDNEMHYRIRKHGYRLCYNPQIVSYQYARSTLKRMIRQKWGNGYWVGRTLYVCPGCISVYHLVPAAFVAGIIVTTLLLAFGLWPFSAIMWGLYLLFGVLNVIMTAVRERFHPLQLLMPALYLILHVCYGAGTITGAVAGLFKKTED